jgi:hypothetical protein
MKATEAEQISYEYQNRIESDTQDMEREFNDFWLKLKEKYPESKDFYGKLQQSSYVSSYDYSVQDKTDALRAIKQAAQEGKLNANLRVLFSTKQQEVIQEYLQELGYIAVYCGHCDDVLHVNWDPKHREKKDDKPV